MLPQPIPAELEIGLHRLDAKRYSVELRSRPPGSDADMAPVRGTATFDLQKLQAAGWEGAKAAGQALTERLFADRAVLEHYQQACAAADGAGAVLRVRLFIGPTAPDLHALRWELLLDPGTGTPIATRDRVLFSRYLSSHDWRSVKLRPKESLRALLVIANPSDLDKYGMAKVDVEGAQKQAIDAMGDIRIEEVTGASTFSRLIDRMSREEFDILYLVAHGAMSIDEEDSLLWLEDESSASDKRPGRDLVDRLGELPCPPRLVVLASCQGGDTTPRPDDGALVALGPRLAEAGIPAVVAMQGNVSMATVGQFMPVFFRELCIDGQIDRAMARARFAVKHRPDVASPVLFLRLSSGRIWYVPRFAQGPGQDDFWPGLMTYLKPSKPKCMPILGSGLLERYLGPTRDFARAWAERNHFPLASHAREDLPQVAQYLSVTHRAAALRSMFEDALNEAMRRQLGGDATRSTAEVPSAVDLLSRIGAKCRQEKRAEPHAVLAALPFPIYLTTNPDRLLVEALREAGKRPEVGLCPWREAGDWSESIFAPGREPDFRPSVDRPLVYNLFGRLEDPASLVLTEDDYFDFLIGLTRNNELIPAVVRRALVDSCLLFLGFRLDDWDFRIVFRSLMARGGRSRSADYAHLAVQVDPEEGRNLDPEGTRRFLQRYFDDVDIRIYWGHVVDFASQLREHWEGRDQQPPSGGRP